MSTTCYPTTILGERRHCLARAVESSDSDHDGGDAYYEVSDMWTDDIDSSAAWNDAAHHADTADAGLVSGAI